MTLEHDLPEPYEFIWFVKGHDTCCKSCPCVDLLQQNKWGTSMCWWLIYYVKPKWWKRHNIVFIRLKYVCGGDRWLFSWFVEGWGVMSLITCWGFISCVFIVDQIDADYITKLKEIDADYITNSKTIWTFFIYLFFLLSNAALEELLPVCTRKNLHFVRSRQCGTQGTRDKKRSPCLHNYCVFLTVLAC